MIYDKLVRDRIPDIIKREGKTPIYWPLNDDDYLNALLSKLVEEFMELTDAATDEEKAEEIADIYSVWLALKEHFGVSWKLFEKIHAKKSGEKGQFGKKLFLHEVKDSTNQ